MQDDVGKLILRLTIGVLILMHGVNKLLGGISGIESMVAAYNLPAILAYGVYFGELLGPVLIIAGLFTRIGAILIVINMVVAVSLAHMGDLLIISQNGGYRLELQALFLFGALAVFFLGAGRFSLGGAGRWS
ncbi:MAG TPA: DoxX family protein [Rhizomicrobium sp.]|nr:DoxX family protein [Rhizomicrobium sp.]